MLERMVRDLSVDASRKIKDARLTEIVKQSADVARWMERMAEMVDGMRAFAEPANLAKVVEWINQQRGWKVMGSTFWPMS